MEKVMENVLEMVCEGDGDGDREDGGEGDKNGGDGHDDNEGGKNDENYSDDLIIFFFLKTIIRISWIVKVTMLSLPCLPLDPLEFLHIRSVDLTA